MNETGFGLGREAGAEERWRELGRFRERTLCKGTWDIEKSWGKVVYAFLCCLY